MKQVLAADIGGTNSRFGLFETTPQHEPKLVAAHILPTTGARSFSELLRQLEQDWMPLDDLALTQAVLAVAGPIQGQRCQLTNAAWAIDLDHSPELPQNQTVLINDFVAQALGCLTSTVRLSSAVIQAGLVRSGPVAAMGAGTGLGACVLTPWPQNKKHFAPLASEAGHTPVVFQTKHEQALADFMASQVQRAQIIGDDLLSGRGLSKMHTFLTGRDLEPVAVAAEIGPNSPTTAWFARFFGRACRIYALHVLPLGGFFICGGLAAKNPFLITHPEFLREFHDCPTYGSLLAEIPIYLVTHTEAGLYGAAQYAALFL